MGDDMQLATDKTENKTATGLPRYWPLLFPLTYLVHIAEEYYGGFPNWSSRFLGFHLTPEGFLQLNAVAWMVMLGVSAAATRYASLPWLVVPFAVATFINGCAHAIASVITASYSPGVISGLTLWFPLGVITLRRSYRHVPHRVFWIGVGLGALLHVVVTVLAIAG